MARIQKVRTRKYSYGAQVRQADPGRKERPEVAYVFGGGRRVFYNRRNPYS